MDQNNLNQSGIYVIINMDANRVYVGSAVCVAKRWKEHRRELRRGTHTSHRLQHGWNKYGEDAFSFYFAEPVPDRSRLIEREQLWINGLMAANPDIGYNLRELAGSMLGYKHSDQTRDKMAKSQTGKKRPFITKEHMSKMCEAAARANTGRRRVFSPEHCAKLKESNLRKAPPTAETRAKMSKAHRRKKGLKARMAKVRMAKWQLSFKF